MADVRSDRPFAYDELDYPVVLSTDMSPDRIRASALAHGLAGPSVETASYLEIGCASGINATAFAASTPGARAVGFDLAAGAIAVGVERARAAGITNVDLHQGDILTYPRDGEKFDYIAAHGVFAWIPQHVRGPMLELIAARLAPGGIVYLGYDALPTASVKYAINRFLVGAIQHIPDPMQKISVAMKLAEVLARHQRGFSRFKTVLDHLVKEVPKYIPGYFYHDWIAEHYAPISLPDLAKAAAPYGLAFAGNASLTEIELEDLDEEARNILQILGADQVQRNVIVDLMRGSHSYRTDLFVRADAPPPIQPQPWRQLSWAFSGTREEIVDEGTPATRYVHGGVTAICRTPNVVKVVDFLFERSPGEFSHDALRAATGLSEDELDGVLTDQIVRRLLDSHASAQPFVLKTGERPTASGLTRTLFAGDDQAPNLRHRMIKLEDGASRLFVALSDGTRRFEDIAAAINEVYGAAVSAAEARDLGHRLAQLGLFEA